MKSEKQWTLKFPEMVNIEEIKYTTEDGEEMVWHPISVKGLVEVVGIKEELGEAYVKLREVENHANYQWVPDKHVTEYFKPVSSTRLQVVN